MKRRIEELLRRNSLPVSPSSTPNSLKQLRKPSLVFRNLRLTQVVVTLALLIVLLWWARTPPQSLQQKPPHGRASQQRDIFDDVERDDLVHVESGNEKGDALVSSRDLAMEDVGSLIDGSTGDDSTIAALTEEDGDVSLPVLVTNEGNGNSSRIGVGAQCHRPTCRLCSGFRIDNRPTEFVLRSTRSYLSHHVRLGVVTGSFDDFFRMDLGLCTWMGHVPSESLFVFTDHANRSAMTHVGTWHEARLPNQLKFSKKQTQAKGYTIDWIRAQYRFFQAFDTLAENTTSSSLLLHWAAVVDDDTFVNIEGMKNMLLAYDIRELLFLNITVPTLQRQRSLSKVVGVQTSSTTKENDHLHLETLISTHRHRFRPLYLNDNGWGGAGHFMNFAALKRFVNGSETTCVDRYMVKRGYASDVTLRHCLPKLGIHTINEKRLNHCQAAFLKQRLASPGHVSAHIKRDIVMPRPLAVWRTRLYYQVVYHRNLTSTSSSRLSSKSHNLKKSGDLTLISDAASLKPFPQQQPQQESAFDLLMEVGSCAYGYSCKLRKCNAEHDAAALRKFLENSGNGTFVPTL